MMTKEIELKLFLGQEQCFVTAKEKLSSALRFIGESTEIDVYYTNKYKDFIQPEECLRIRERDGCGEITWKPPTTAPMVEKKQYWKQEINVDIARQAQTVRELLKNLDFIEYVTVEKFRQEYEYDTETKVMLDLIKGVGVFAEIETMSTDSEHGTRKNADVVMELGFTEARRVSRPYRDIVKDGHLS